MRIAWTGLLTVPCQPPRESDCVPMPMNISRPLSIAGLLALSLTSCTPIVAIRGNLATDQQVAEIKTGESTRDKVQDVLGTPTATGTLDGDTWYYIGRRTEQTAFFAPEVTEQRIVRVRFDTAGLVSEVAEIPREDGRGVTPVDRTTPTAGRELNFVEQLLGNLSRPSKKGGKGEQ